MHSPGRVIKVWMGKRHACDTRDMSLSESLAEMTLERHNHTLAPWPSGTQTHHTVLKESVRLVSGTLVEYVNETAPRSPANAKPCRDCFRFGLAEEDIHKEEFRKLNLMYAIGAISGFASLVHRVLKVGSQKLQKFLVQQKGSRECQDQQEQLSASLVEPSDVLTEPPPDIEMAETHH
eukprot:gnl/MRDRNA2_/MRDRNA2_9802_c0_seq1.p1 gnl/MRDRNA2_/MRDRNA2_9802_c0~~gnl/MRDRNA2_/MRDRNA2_9802_c0_seq1.p1  ORF type:complete len:188 (-),score=33.93 gnl/MRDRNA2_/MRDRNA2_9802_c0_seq1:153-686(-)